MVLDLESGPGEFLYQDDVWLDFGLTITEADIAALTASPRVDVHATFTFRDESYDVGLHLKGTSSYCDFTEKPAFKIDFHQWVPDQDFHGVRRLTLNNMWQDSSMLAEHTTYALFAMAGRPAPRHGYARVAVNGEPFGLYGIVETMDEAFVDRWWDDDDLGNLYEGDASGDLTDHGVNDYDLQEAGEPTDTSDLEALAAALDASTPATFTGVLAANFDIDGVLDAMAIEMIAANSDGYVSSGNNYLLYHAPVAGKWWLIPWGADQTWDDDQPLWAELDGVLAEGCFAAAACRTQLEVRAAALLDIMEAGDLAGLAEAEGARILPVCEDDPRAKHGCDNDIEEFVDYVYARPGQLR